jgi:hypothetical protein
MAESVRARLVDDNGLVPIEGVSKDGVALFGETSAWPRSASLRVNPISPGTKKELQKLRRKHDWGKGELKLKYRLHHGEIILRGVDAESLPEGTWDVGFNVYDMVTERINPIRIPKGGQAEVQVYVKNKVKKIEVRPKLDWDSEIRRVIQASELDGAPGDDWVCDETTRANRRACALNILAVCRELGLIQKIERLFFTEVDRVYAIVESEFGKLLGDQFHEPNPPAHKIHKRLLKEPLAKKGKSYRLLSYRQKRNPSMQVVTATPKGGGPHLAELDIDLGDVLDPLGFVIHSIEVLHPKRTDHLGDVRKMLEDTDARKFLAWERA